jgi:uncharacterized protein YbjT (DUF2867 family)
MIVVTTPTGRVGSKLVAHLLLAGKDVRVIARDPAKLSSTIKNQVNVVEGSTDDPAVLDKAFDGADALFWLLPPPFKADDIEAYGLRFARTASEAIRVRGVRWVVAVSSLGRGLPGEAGLASLLHRTDGVIESTGVAYRALWCPGFMENLLVQAQSLKHQGTFFQPVNPDLKIPHVATRDIADAAAKLLLGTSWTGQGGVAVLGSEDLSFNDIADTMSDVLGEPIRCQQIPLDDYRKHLLKAGASETMAQAMVEMSAAVGEGLYNTEPRTPENTTPTSFRQWCEQVMKPAVLSSS